jgi:eukaryotic-like serine/threonine-protein kinase
MAAVVAYTTGRFGEVLEAVDQSMALQASLGKEEWDRLTTGGAYEVTVLRLCRMIALTYLGRFNEARGEFHDWLHDARRRGDRFTAANAARGLNVVWLFDDDPERARHELGADLWTPPRESFHIQQWMVLRSAVQIHLYCGTAARASEELAEELDRSKRALLMRVRPLRAEQDWILGRLRLAEAEAAPVGSKTEARRRRQALAAARRLSRFDLPQSKTAAALLGAGVAFQRGDLDAAVELLLRAESIASRASLRVMEAAAQRRRGQIIRGSAGHELIATVDRWARGQGIRAPEKIARMYAPGFDRAER